jgi:hypothetical protein
VSIGGINLTPLKIDSEKVYFTDINEKERKGLISYSFKLLLEFRGILSKLSSGHNPGFWGFPDPSILTD